jgi:hypothetical protein
MARPGWLNENAGRSFPLLDTTAGLPTDVVVDFGCLMGPASLYSGSTHSIWLASIYRIGSEFVFTVTSDAPGCEESLVFTRQLEDKTVTEFVEVLPDTDEEACGLPAVWSAYLTTGSLRQLAAMIRSGETVNGPFYFEPALTRSLVGQFITAIGVQNEARTKITDWPGDPRTYVEQATCVQGRIRLREGYNCRIIQDVYNNAITIDATVGGGAGEPCVEVPMSAEEMEISYPELLDGSPRCDDVLRSINRAGGRAVNIVAGAGVTVTPDPHGNRIVVDVHMKTMEGC